MNTTAIQADINSLQWMFTIVLALAIGEAFKQFIVDRTSNPAERHVQWDRLPGLLSFLFLVVPFYHGMVRYFYEAYNQQSLPQPYGIWLGVDCSAFTIEAILFFVLSRSLCLLQWRSFYVTTIILNSVDLIWACIDACFKRSIPLNWIILDVATLMLIGLVFVCFRSNFNNLSLPIPIKKWLRMPAATIPVIVLLGRTVMDYSINHSFYFPPNQPPAVVAVSQKPQMPADNSAKRRVYFAGPLFTQAQWQWNQRLAEELRKMNFDVTLPQESATPMLNGVKPFNPQMLYSSNIDGIDKSDIVLAILDEADPDSGTCWECGYAVKSEHPIIGLRTDIRRSGGDDPKSSINLMLSQSCQQVIILPLDRINDLSWIAQKVSESINKALGQGRKN